MMMMRSIAMMFITITGLIACKPAKKGNPDKVVDRMTTSMQVHADSLLLDEKISAVSIGIHHRGKDYIGHYGELDPGKGNVPTNRTLYEIASVSKTMAGLLVAYAELEGKLQLDDDIRKFFDTEYPNLEYRENPIRIKHLLTHTSGLPRYLPKAVSDLFLDIDATLPFKIYEIEKSYGKETFYTDLRQLELDTLPGTTYAYSNVDTEIIAHILEKVYGEDYEMLLKKYVLKKAGMPHTKISLSESEIKYLAKGYGEDGRMVPQMVNPLWGAGGGLKSTLPDLINYMKFQLDENNALVQKSHELIYDNNETGTAISYCWPVETDDKDGTYYGHHGGALGTQNYFFIMPKHDLGISIITNQSDQETAAKLYTTVGHILDDIR